MSAWMNEAEIDNAMGVFNERAPKLYPYVRFLSDYRDIINANSDGWPYWSHGTKCAAKLTEAIQEAQKAMRESRAMPDESIFKKALTPIRTFVIQYNGKHSSKLTVPELWTPPLIGQPAQSYPELRAHVMAICNATAIEINAAAARTESAMPYKTQFLLECVIEELQRRV